MAARAQLHNPVAVVVGTESCCNYDHPTDCWPVERYAGIIIKAQHKFHEPCYRVIKPLHLVALSPLVFLFGNFKLLICELKFYNAET